MRAHFTDKEVKAKNENEEKFYKLKTLLKILNSKKRQTSKGMRSKHINECVENEFLAKIVQTLNNCFRVYKERNCQDTFSNDQWIQLARGIDNLLFVIQCASFLFFNFSFVYIANFNSEQHFKTEEFNCS